MPRRNDHPSRALVLAAFAAIYFLWGSTYLAIKYAVETLPPFLMTGIRFVIAGGLLYAWGRMRGASRPTWPQWRASLVVGLLLITGGTATLGWAEQTVPSGIASLVLATTPLWIVGMESLGRNGRPPGPRLAAGLLVGLGGLAVLIGPDLLNPGGDIDPMGAAVLVGAAATWAAGSLYSRGAALPESPALGMGTQMLAGGAITLATAVLLGEPRTVRIDAISAVSLWALLYLIIAGALVGFTAYLWLLRVSTPSRVATHAYVNPVVAVLLGWAIAGEPVTARTAAGMAIIVVAVALIVGAPSRSAGVAPPRAVTSTGASETTAAHPAIRRRRRRLAAIIPAWRTRPLDPATTRTSRAP